MHHNLKGFLEFFVLTTIPTEYMFAKEILARINSVTKFAITEGTLYPLLNRLKRSQLIESHIAESDVGPIRKFYELTPKGRAHLQELNREWKQLNQIVHKLRRSPTLDR